MGLLTQDMKLHIFFAMEVNASQTTLWDAIHPPPLEQQKG